LEKILTENGYYENGNYYFYIRNHLGSNAVVADQNGTEIQRTYYYPFGMTMAISSEPAAQPYKYGGKELDVMNGLNQYDYSARYYDPAYGRFTTMDPLAEKYYSISPYAYCMNNPIRFNDPTGMVPEDRVRYAKSMSGISYPSPNETVASLRTENTAEYVFRLFSPH
jgi:RHS repeat-associated protein